MMLRLRVRFGNENEFNCLRLKQEFNKDNMTLRTNSKQEGLLLESQVQEIYEG